MKRAVLIVDHGSRRAEANHVVEELAAQLRGRDPAVLVGVAHLEIAPPNVDDALAGLVSQGADTVVVYPHFLAPGRHSRVDLPAQVRHAAARHPGLEVFLAEAIGAHPGLVDLLCERVAEARPLERESLPKRERPREPGAD